MINRKGHMPTVFLLVGTIVLIVYTLFVFASFDNSFNSKSQLYSTLIDDYNFKENYPGFILKAVVDNAVKKANENDFLNSFEFEVKEIAKRRDYNARKLAGNLYGRLESGDFVVSQNGEKYVITLEDVFVESKAGKNSLKRTFNLSVEFDEKGVISFGNWIFSCSDVSTGVSEDIEVSIFGCDHDEARDMAEELFKEKIGEKVISCSVKVRPENCE